MRRTSLSLSLAALTLLGGAPAAFAQQAVTLDGPAAQPTKKEAPDGTVRFQTGSSLITPESAAALDRIAEFILGQAAGDILVVGHTDRKGSEQANLRLSQSRAKKVKTELSKRGVPAWRIKVMGVGYGEPLSREETKAADDLNRRVEVWVGTKEAIAWISYIYRQVQAQKPAADWEGAELQMPLRRLFRVRTLERSAGEVSFGEGRTLFLGPSALVVIYGKDERKDPKPRAVADITVEQGSILASLGQAPVLADTKDARFRMKADWIRVDANEAKQQSTVSVYKGETTVNAENKTVKVEEGYGTRVKRGQAPEAPTPLPPAPQWDGSGTILAQEGRGVNLSWRPAIAHEGAMIELSGPDDPNLKRPRDTRFVEGRSAALDDVPAGVYWVRVSSVDERDIVGHPGVARRLVILPQPQAAEGQLTWSEDRWLLAKPGKVRLPQASGVKTTWLDEAGRPLPDVIEVGPGVRRLETRLTDDAGRELGAGVVLVEVRPMTMRLIEVESSKPMGDHDEVTFVVEARDAKGQPTDKLHLVAGEPDPRLLETTADPTWMMPLSSDRSGEGAVSSIGEGRYRLTRVLPKSQGSSARYVLVYDADRDIGQHILLPVTGPLTRLPSPPARSACAWSTACTWPSPAGSSVPGAPGTPARGPRSAGPSWRRIACASPSGWRRATPRPPSPPARWICSRSSPGSPSASWWAPCARTWASRGVFGWSARSATMVPRPTSRRRRRRWRRSWASAGTTAASSCSSRVGMARRGLGPLRIWVRWVSRGCTAGCAITSSRGE